MSDRLCVVMPVYNEEAAIGGVLEKWAKSLDVLKIDYVIRPYNDGSKDASLAVMREFVRQHPDPHVEVRDKPNGGHGHTILTGYREAAADGFDWIFQIDSDDEMGPEKFGELWSRRADYDFLVGIRDGRVQALPRKVISFVSRCCVRLFYGRKTVWDVNTPYRLMRVSAFKESFDRIPLTTFAPNVILSGLVARKRLRFFELRVPQHDRTTGEVSIKKWKLLKAAIRSFAQTILFSFRCPGIGIAQLSLAVLFGAIALGRVTMNRFYSDFQWMPAKILMEGENPYLYSLNRLPWRTWTRIEANQIPSCLLMLAPWTFLEYPVACRVWTICNLVFTAVFFFYLYKTFFGKDAPVSVSRGFIPIVLLCLFGVPYRVLIGNTQHLMFSLAFFMPAVYYFLRGKNVLAGVLIALCFFKYTTIAPLLLVFVGLRAWKSIAIGASLHVVATCGVAVWLHESPVTLVVQSLKVGSTLLGQGTSDIPSFCHWLSLPYLDAATLPLYAIYALLGLYICWAARKDIVLALASLAVLSNVMFYHRVYDYVSLAFAMLLVARMLTRQARMMLLDKFLLLLICFDVFYIFFGGHLRNDLLVGLLGYPEGVLVPAVMMPLEHLLLLALILKVSFKNCLGDYEGELRKVADERS